MKVLSLNIWGGKIHKPLFEFIESQTNDVDVFCFQEVFKSGKDFFNNYDRLDILSDIKSLSKNYNVYYSPVIEGTNLSEWVDYEIYWGLATFVKKSIKVLSEGSFFVFRNYNKKFTLIHKLKDKNDYVDVPRIFHYVIVEEEGKKKLIANLHGYWIPDSKLDTPERIEQSKKIVKFLNSQEMQKIVCGDFNLNPDTKSMMMFDDNMINLITKHNIKNTRSNLHTRKDKFADYILVSKDVKVKKFEVIKKDVSDHLPLYLEFN